MFSNLFSVKWRAGCGTKRSNGSKTHGSCAGIFFWGAGAGLHDDADMVAKLHHPRRWHNIGALKHKSASARSVTWQRHISCLSLNGGNTAKYMEIYGLIASYCIMIASYCSVCCNYWLEYSGRLDHMACPWGFGVFDLGLATKKCQECLLWHALSTYIILAQIYHKTTNQYTSEQYFLLSKYCADLAFVAQTDLQWMAGRW